jgi:hypothetical protein
MDASNYIERMEEIMTRENILRLIRDKCCECKMSMEHVPRDFPWIECSELGCQLYPLKDGIDKTLHYTCGVISDNYDCN